MLYAHVVHLMRLHGGIVKVNIVKLYLHEFHEGFLCEDHVQHVRLVVERQAHVAQFAFLLQLVRHFIGVAGLVLFVVPAVLGVHEIEVEILHAADLQLLVHERADIRLGLEVTVGKLVRQQELASVMTRGNALPYRLFALPVDVAVSGIEVVEARFYERVSHAAGLGYVHLIACHGQAHAAKAKIAPYLREKPVLFHIALPANETYIFAKAAPIEAAENNLTLTLVVRYAFRLGRR